MNNLEIENLLNVDKKPFNDDFSEKTLEALDLVILENSEDISEEVFGVYKKFVVMKQNAPQSMKVPLFTAINNFIKEEVSHSNFVNALMLSRFLMVKTEPLPEIYFDVSESLFKLGQKSLYQEFLQIYENKETNSKLKLITLGNFYNIDLHDYKTAIKYYEQYLKLDKTTAVVYTILASLYNKAYGDSSLEKQIYYLTASYKLNPKNRTVLHGLAFGYEKINDKTSAKFYYTKLLETNPTEIDFYNYGAFLISCGDFKEGHKYFTHRFLLEDVNSQYPKALESDKKWDFVSDISDKTLLVHYEQGFGDTFMYCRFLPQLKNFCKKLVFVAQDSLVDLLIQSDKISNGIEIVSRLDGVEYDYYMALLDAPLVVKTEVPTIPFTDGYLNIDSALVEDYSKKYIRKSTNLKVGISYHGDERANYNDRDIDFETMKILFNNKNIDFYSLQVTDNEEVGIISLGSTFRNFTDTACAIKNMDVVISTDNVILNLSGALGVKTFGLFNRLTNFRWYQLDKDNVGWYKSVKPFQVQKGGTWAELLFRVAKHLENNC